MGLRICPEPCSFSASLPSDSTSEGLPAFLDFSGQIWLYTVDVSWRASRIFIWGQLNPILNDQPWLSLFFLMSVTSPSIVSVAPGFPMCLFWLSQASLSSAPKSLQVFISTYKEKLPSGQHTSQLHPILRLQSIKLFISLDCVPFLSFVQTNFCNCHIVIVMSMQAESLPSVCLLIKTVIPHFKNNTHTSKWLKWSRFLLCVFYHNKKKGMRIDYRKLGKYRKAWQRKELPISPRAMCYRA